MFTYPEKGPSSTHRQSGQHDLGEILATHREAEGQDKMRGRKQIEGSDPKGDKAKVDQNRDTSGV